jgi:ribosomal protein S18 acetylase RimI-like enzyme
MTEFGVAAMDHRVLADAQRLHALQMAAYAQEAALLGARSIPPLERTVLDIQSGCETYLAAFEHSTLIGALGLEQDSGEIHIASLVVAPTWQRQGVARALMRALLAQHGAQNLTVQTAARNLPALALYAQFGFIETQRWLVGPEPLELVKLQRNGTY